jgi:hypothetical protein
LGRNLDLEGLVGAGARDRTLTGRAHHIFDGTWPLDRTRMSMIARS